jgi:branched-chain amino acid transport system substrate-binding protein
MRLKPLGSTIVAAGLVFTAAACGDSSDSGGGGSEEGLSGTITISAPLSLTDVAAFAGLDSRKGMEFAIEEINETGYLGEAKLEADFVDVALDDDKALSAVRSAISGDSVAIVGMTLGNHSLAAAPIAQQSKVPFVVVNSGGLKDVTEVGDYVYQTDVSQFRYADKMTEELEARGITETSVIWNDDVPAVIDLHDEYEELFPEFGIEVASDNPVASTTTDFSAVATSIAKDDPQAVAVLTRGPVAIIEALRKAGYDGQIWSQAGLAGGVGAAAAPVTDGVLFTANAAKGSDIPSMEKFFTDYEAATGELAYAFAAQGYDAVWAVARAMKASDCSTRECVKDGLAEVAEEGYEGALGAVTFEDRNAVGPGVILEDMAGEENFVR